MTTPESSPTQDRPPKRRGRRPKISPAIRDAFCEGLRLAMTIKASCELAGISEPTYHRWMEEGERASEGSIRDFYLAVKEAQIAAEKRLLDIIFTEAERGQEKVREVTNMDANGVVTGTQRVVERSPRDARIAMMILERRFPEQYGRRVLDHKGIPPAQNAAPPVINLIFDDGEGDPDVIPFQYVDNAEIDQALSTGGMNSANGMDLEAYEEALANGEDV